MVKIYQTEVISAGDVLKDSAKIHALATEYGAFANGNYDLKSKIEGSQEVDPNKQRLGVYDLFLDNERAEEFRRRILETKLGHCVYIDDLEFSVGEDKL